MLQYKCERLLTTVYGLVMLLGLVCSICCAVAWNHWKFVLDTCSLDVTCGCILHAKSTFRYFTGGHVSHCHWAVYGLLPAVAIALIFFLYHGYRVCINSKGRPPKEHGETVVTRSNERITMVTRMEDRRGADGEDPEAIHLCWPPAAVLCSIVALHSLIHAAMMTDGYYKTCYEYRNDLTKLLRATGNQVAVIQSRLSCAAIFDFMDYLQPDVRDRRRGDFINTAAALQCALISAWLGVALWIFAVWLNSNQARRSRALRE